jgi:hypothetical protein
VRQRSFDAIMQLHMLALLAQAIQSRRPRHRGAEAALATERLIKEQQAAPIDKQGSEGKNSGAQLAPAGGPRSSRA